MQKPCSIYKEEIVVRRQIILGLVFGVFFSTAAFGTLMAEIRYETNELGAGRWQYTYDVTNISLTPAIEEFTIWFDFGLCENLAIETPYPPSGDWDEVVIEPEPVLQDDGAYDAKALNSGVGVGETASGFAVSFDWLGVGEPGSQSYEIIDPVTFETIDSGYTMPEPSTLLLLGLGGLVLRKKC